MDFTGADVWDFDLNESLFFLLQVAEVVDEGVNFHLIFLFCLVQNEIRCQKHEVCKFIPLWFVTFQGKLKYESAHSTSRMQNTNSLAAVFFHRPFEIRFHLFNEGLKTLLPLFLPLSELKSRFTSCDHSL